MDVGGDWEVGPIDYHLSCGVAEVGLLIESAPLSLRARLIFYLCVNITYIRFKFIGVASSLIPLNFFGIHAIDPHDGDFLVNGQVEHGSW
jgi:hypothetical protein